MEHVSIQSVGGSIHALEIGTTIAQKLCTKLEEFKRSESGVSNVCVALKWGEGSSGYSGDSHYFEHVVDHILSAGGTVILGETEKF
ncbi:hypothetical protein GCM10025859_11720 [Alicyclobacillus fastidiosus]|nr:hypothetical protein GCM10025859_11720 [Alicyclobacillus fastidiosus]